jgi:hypothetical protein
VGAVERASVGRRTHACHAHARLRAHTHKYAHTQVHTHTHACVHCMHVCMHADTRADRVIHPPSSVGSAVAMVVLLSWHQSRTELPDLRARCDMPWLPAYCFVPSSVKIKSRRQGAHHFIALSWSSRGGMPAGARCVCVCVCVCVCAHTYARYPVMLGPWCVDACASLNTRVHGCVRVAAVTPPGMGDVRLGRPPSCTTSSGTSSLSSEVLTSCVRSTSVLQRVTFMIDRPHDVQHAARDGSPSPRSCNFPVTHQRITHRRTSSMMDSSGSAFAGGRSPSPMYPPASAMVGDPPDRLITWNGTARGHRAPSTPLVRS